METLIALDLGTTNFKAALLRRADFQLLGLARIPTPIAQGVLPWQEIEAAEFVRALGGLLADLHRQCPEDFNAAAAITFSTQTNSFLLLDENDHPLTPVILWSDERAAGECAAFRSLLEHPDTLQTTGMIRLGHFAMAAKVGWLQTHKPEVTDRVRRLCLISDYLTLLMTGQHVSEAGAAGFTGLLDIHSLEWWKDGCRIAGVPIQWLPKVVRAGHDLGAVTPAASREFGLPPGCRFIVGCLDQYAGAIGADNNRPGRVSETTGTVLTTVRCAAEFDRRSGLPFFQGPAFRSGWYWQMALEGRGASQLEALRNALPGRPDFDLLDAEAEAIAPGCEGLRLTGPIGNNPEAAFANWQPGMTRGHMARCVMESIAFLLAGQLRILCGNALPEVLACCGGASRSRVWLQIKADVLGIPCQPAPSPEPACLGAALLAETTLRGAPELLPPAASPAHNRLSPRPEYQAAYAALLAQC